MSTHQKDGPQLNASQRRSVEALLESVESMLAQVERLIPDSANNESSITSIANDLPDHFAKEAPQKISELRKQIGTLASRINTTPRHVSKRRNLKGMLSAQLMRVEDVTPARLASYGAVHPSFAEQVSPALRQIQISLKEIVDLLQD